MWRHSVMGLDAIVGLLEEAILWDKMAHKQIHSQRPAATSSKVIQASGDSSSEHSYEHLTANTLRPDSNVVTYLCCLYFNRQIYLHLNISWVNTFKILNINFTYQIDHFTILNSLIICYNNHSLSKQAGEVTLAKSINALAEDLGYVLTVHTGCKGL